MASSASDSPPAGPQTTRPLYGGQAVIEGVMIRGVRHYSLAVRQPDGHIFCDTEPVSSRFSGRIRRVPFVRGVLILGETLWYGMKSLQRSAIIAAGEADSADGADSAASKWVMGMTMAVALALGIGIFLVLPLLAVRLLEVWIESRLASNLIEGVIRLIILVAYVAGISAMKDIRRVYAYHGAEHMAVHAYEAGQPLTVENVRRHPTPHPRCGTAFLITVAIVSVAAFAILDAVLYSGLGWRVLSRIVPIPVVAAVSYEIIRFAGAHRQAWFGKALSWPGLALQRITTRQPDEDQIQVAIAAMEAALAADGQPSPANDLPSCDTVTQSG